MQLPVAMEWLIAIILIVFSVGFLYPKAWNLHRRTFRSAVAVAHLWAGKRIFSDRGDDPSTASSNSAALARLLQSAAEYRHHRLAAGMRKLARGEVAAADLNAAASLPL